MSAKTTIEEQLVKYLEDAHAMEQHVEKGLTSLIDSTDIPELLKPLMQHRDETREQLKRLEGRLQAHGAKPSVVKEAGMIFAAIPTSALYHARKDSAAKHARDGYVIEHLEIAAYQLLKRVAQRAGDQETVQVAERNLQEEQRMAETIDQSWDLALDLSLKQEGVIGAPPVAAPKSMVGQATKKP